MWNGDEGTMWPLMWYLLYVDKPHHLVFYLVIWLYNLFVLVFFFLYCSHFLQVRGEIRFGIINILRLSSLAVENRTHGGFCKATASLWGGVCLPLPKYNKTCSINSSACSQDLQATNDCVLLMRALSSTWLESLNPRPKKNIPKQTKLASCTGLGC